MTDVPRRALITDVMTALHDQPTEDTGYMKVERLKEKLLASGIPHGVDDAIVGARELGLIEPHDPDSWHEELFLTDNGKRWTPGQELEPIRYAFLVEGKMVVDTLAGWAELWKGAHYSGNGEPGTKVFLWSLRNSGGELEVYGDVTRNEDDYTDYRIWAAGEIAFAQIDGRA